MTLRRVPGLAAAVLVGAAVAVPEPMTIFGAFGHGSEPRAAPAEPAFERTEEYDYDPPQAGTYALPVLKPAADGRALGPDGSPLALHAAMAGHVTVLAFIYTRCSDPQGCPLSVGLLYELRFVSEVDPAIGRNLRLIAVSIDPDHDTPAVMADYGGLDPVGDPRAADLLFLTTRSQADLAPILANYDQAVGRKSDAADPFGPRTHQLRVYLIDRRARIRNIYSLGFMDPRLVAADIKTLLLEDQRDKPGG